MSRMAMVLVSSSSRSARVDLPWSMWAMIEKLRMRLGSVTRGLGGCWIGVLEPSIVSLEPWYVCFSLGCCAFRPWPRPCPGRVTDGRQGLAGVRVYPDRLVRVRSEDLPPMAITDAEGRFALDLGPGDTVLAVEKSGWQRDLVPLADLAGRWCCARPRPTAGRRCWCCAWTCPASRPLRSDAELRSMLFSRRPGEASAANYYYEISKGSLELEEGALLHLAHPGPAQPAHRTRPASWWTTSARSWCAGSWSRSRAWTSSPSTRWTTAPGRPGPDGKPDHLWIVPPGPSRTITAGPRATTPPSASSCRCPGTRTGTGPSCSSPRRPRWATSSTRACTPWASSGWATSTWTTATRSPPAAGTSWTPASSRAGTATTRTGFPWQEDTGYSPAQPMGWIRAELWYRGRFRATVSTLRVRGPGRAGWTPWSGPPGTCPSAWWCPTRGSRGRFWELNVRRPWGFDRGRTGDRWGPGYEGLVVARVDPSHMAKVDGLRVTHVPGPGAGAERPPGLRRTARSPATPAAAGSWTGPPTTWGPGRLPPAGTGRCAGRCWRWIAAGRMRVRVTLAPGRPQ